LQSALACATVPRLRREVERRLVLDVLLRAALQAEGLRGVSCATERRVATFMLP
jgi:hypothetical protein